MSEVTDYRIDLQRTLVKDGPKFLSHTVIIRGAVAYLMPTISAMLFCVVYIVVGVFLMSLASYILLESDKIDLAVFVGGFGIAITTFGASLIQPFLKRASFNRKTSVFNNNIDRNVKLHHIVSLQINNKIVKRKQALNYHCYELNMLTKNGRRINILNHNNISQLLIDAQLLGQFLKVEVKDMQREIIL
ncbi:MAG: hypothetical protein ACI9ES_000016 [Oceanospirillaceae bacterium]|jgi:hypothetical protein